MNVELLHVTPLEIVIKAIRQCYESIDKSDSKIQEVKPGKNEYVLGLKDKKLIKQVIDYGHTSTLEHITFNFQIKGISRLCLQELARHRISSFSVKSTRYTLKELKTEEFFDTTPSKIQESLNRSTKYINLTGEYEIDYFSLLALENLRSIIHYDKWNTDLAKYAVPECYKTDLVWSINARSLQNFLNLRLSHKAHFEIKELATLICKCIPEDYKILFKDIL